MKSAADVRLTPEATDRALRERFRKTTRARESDYLAGAIEGADRRTVATA